MKFENSLLDAAGRVYPILFTTRDASDFPTTVGGSPLATVVDDLVATRENNQAPSATKASLIKNLTDTRDMIKILDGPTGIVVADDLDHDPPPLPPVSPLVPPPAVFPTIILRETFDNIPEEFNNQPIPGFTFVRLGSGYVGAHIEHDPPSSPKCYMLGGDSTEPTIMVMPLSVSSRLIFEFDFMIEIAPSEVTCSPEGMVGFCNAAGDFSDGRNSVIFRADGKIQFGCVSPKVIGTWEDEKWVRIKADLDIDGQTADVLVNGSLILPRVPIQSLANLTHFGIRSPSNPTKNIYSNIDSLILSQ